MSRHHDDVYLLDIREACARIGRCSAGVTGEAFEGNTEKQDAIIRQLEIIEEATGHLSPAFRAAHRDTPWQRIKGLRDALIHGYAHVDVKRVWHIATHRFLLYVLTRNTPVRNARQVGSVSRLTATKPPPGHP